jgi:hypothetical protein
MNYNCKAIDMDAQVAANREIIKELPQQKLTSLTWNPAKLAYDVDESTLDLSREMFGLW